MRPRGFTPFRSRPREDQVVSTPPALQRAHELMASGDYAGAAFAFEQLASAAETRNGPRAPFLFLQAGRARVSQNQPALAVAHFKRGLMLLGDSGRYNQLYRVGQRVMQELKMRGLEKEAREIAVVVGANIPAIAEMPTERCPDLGRVVLPTHCASCGGPVRTAEVEWVDPITAECPYCGTPIRVEHL